MNKCPTCRYPRKYPDTIFAGPWENPWEYPCQNLFHAPQRERHFLNLTLRLMRKAGVKGRDEMTRKRVIQAANIDSREKARLLAFWKLD